MDLTTLRSALNNGTFSSWRREEALAKCCPFLVPEVALGEKR